MTTSLSVAKYLLALANDELEPQYVTQMQLHKLLYYVQGWSLAKRGRAAFVGRIEAWKYGPVVKEVRPEFSRFENQPIVGYDVGNGATLSVDDRFFVRSVWESYKGYSPTQLVAKTHGERPWVQARADVPDHCPSDEEIPIESMREFFRGETTDSIGFDSDRQPDWTSDDDLFIDAAQYVFVKDRNLLQRLA